MDYWTEQAAASLNEEFGSQRGFEAIWSSSAVGMRLPGKGQKVYILQLFRLGGGHELVLVSYSDANGLSKRTKLPNVDAGLEFLQAEARAHFSAME